MKKTSYWALAGTAVFVAAATGIITWGFYGVLPPIPMSVAITLAVLAIICVFLSIKVKGRIDDGRIGQDRSQLNPVTAAQFLVIAKASEWTGAIIGGAYVGMSCYVIPMSHVLAAAEDDLPAVVSAALAGIALTIAGAYLEHSCHLPPPTDGEPVG